MGKKKQFIKKGEGVKFYLVHRSQKDPLYLDESLGERVLVPADGECAKPDLLQAINGLSLSKKSKTNAEKEEAKRKRLEEQQKFGIYYEDDYNYLQHLRDVDENDNTELEKQETIKIGSVLIKTNEFSDDDKPRTSDSTNENQKPKLLLPSSVFESKYEEDVGYFNQAAPDHDPKINWDPDIVKILDEDPDVNFEDDIEDDFFLKANEETKSKKFNKSYQDDEDEDDEDYDDENDDENDDDDDYEGSDNDSNGHFSGSESQSVKDFETKSRFSNYSMTSSVVKRNSALTHLDEHFEKFYAQYDDDQIGALDTEEIDGYRNNDLVLESALEEFDKLMQKKMYNPERKSSSKAVKNNLEVLVEQEESDGESLDSSENENVEENENNKEFDVVHYTRKKEKEDRFDCETIISTYSTLYNHPSIISEKNEKEIKLSKKSGLPLGVLGEKPKSAKEMDRIDHKITRILPEVSKRTKEETKEEKKARKQAVKEHRRERRVEKKINKLAFKEEKLNQINQIKNTIDNSNIVKLPL